MADLTAAAEALAPVNRELEDGVGRRTAEVTAANQELVAEIERGAPRRSAARCLLCSAGRAEGELGGILVSHLAVRVDGSLIPPRLDG